MIVVDQAQMRGGMINNTPRQVHEWRVQDTIKMAEPLADFDVVD